MLHFVPRIEFSINENLRYFGEMAPVIKKAVR